MAEREEKLRNLTARIKANNHAREEPGELPSSWNPATLGLVLCFCVEVRKVKLAVAAVKPGRRSGIRQGGFSRPMERPHSGSKYSHTNTCMCMHIDAQFHCNLIQAS